MLRYLCSFVNFDSTSNSLWTMVRVLTGEDWHLIMHDCAVSINSYVVILLYSNTLGQRTCLLLLRLW